jgi:hypothetical protein
MPASLTISPSVNVSCNLLWIASAVNVSVVIRSADATKALRAEQGTDHVLLFFLLLTLYPYAATKSRLGNRP